ncbi:MAG: discoidin domain-containing protein [Desulfitobacterium hafniense]|nr:discoidin domain-containing protein [Desulfitobacterium hafniense]
MNECGTQRATPYGYSLWEFSVYKSNFVASSAVNSSYSAEKAFDNDLQTRWSSAFSDPQWIYADLGAIKPINRISLNWEAAYGKSYSIQTSMNLNGTEYYYIRNAEGDIIGLFDGAGTQVVGYTYDSWGKLI